MKSIYANNAINKIEPEVYSGVSSKPKKKVLILAGVHGNEHSSREAAFRIIDYLNSNNNELQNTIVEVRPIYNPTGALYNKREYVHHNTDDLNRHTFFKSKHQIANEFDTLLENVDLLIDIHNSPKCKQMVLMHTNVDYSREVALLKSADNYHALAVFYKSSAISNARYAKEKFDMMAFTYEFTGMLAHDNESEINTAKNIIVDLLIAFDRNDFSNANTLEYDSNEHLAEPLYSPYTGHVYFLPNEDVYCKDAVYGYIRTSTESYELKAPFNMEILARSHNFALVNDQLGLVKRI